MCRRARVVIRKSRTDVRGQPHVVAGRISVASQNVHDASFVHADSLAGTMPDSGLESPPSPFGLRRDSLRVACRAVRLRPSGYGATVFAWLAEPKLTPRHFTSVSEGWCGRKDSNLHGIATASPSSCNNLGPIAADLGKSGSAVSRGGRLRLSAVALPRFRCTVVAQAAEGQNREKSSSLRSWRGTFTPGLT